VRCGCEALEFCFGLDLAAHEPQQQAVGELVGAARAIQGLGVGADQPAHALVRMIR
jgi:hypothetical protein